MSGLSTYLVVVRGEDTGDVFNLLPGQELTAGRAVDVDILLNDKGVSRQHARFWRRDDSVGVDDLRSRNGTFVGAERIRSHKLADGDTIRLGPLAMVRFFVGRSQSEESHRRRVIDQVDLPVLICSEDAGHIEFANSAAQTLLRGVTTDPPASLQEVIRVAVARPNEHPEWQAADGLRMKVRARRMDQRHGTLIVTILPTAKRDEDLSAMLADRYRISRSDARIVLLVCSGLRNAEIAEKLRLSTNTIKQYLNRIFVSLGVSSRTQLMVRIEELRRVDAKGDD